MRKRILAVLLLIAALLPVSTAAAQEEIARVDGAAVTLDGEWQDYQLDGNTYVYCPVVLDANGRLALSVQTCFDDSHYVRLLDANYEVVEESSVSGAGPADPKVTRFTDDLSAGTYYVRVESWNGCRGLFRIMATFIPSVATETGAGDAFADAIPFSAPEACGFLSSRVQSGWMGDPLPEASQDFCDIYVLEAAADRYAIRLIPVEVDSTFQCAVYDASYSVVESGYSNPELTLDLKAGTYYVRVEPSGSQAGDYRLLIEGESAAQAASQPADAPAQADSWESVVLAVGKFSQLSAAGDSVHWGCTNPQVAIVSADGMVIGISAGSAWVAAVPDDFTPTELYFVTVTD